ncbi:hypothetical protein PVT68_14120 [Microbulbifer bruguierae]|uniref:Lipoprotein n=1 Tax=Microbulbifer bruguierae TaxID=3029061 RepID=A0ABY8NAG0_9GAMM|nr:hypothetical protein [Microbulbifer bruguierae]WGL15901.1 hypothetical protein PVT68_14120 [Microbulbifer bruguierae]
MKKVIFIITLLSLQSCAILSNPKTPDEYVERIKTSSLGRINTVTINSPIEKVLTELGTPLYACYDGTSVTWQQNTMVSGRDWKVSLENKENGLKQFALLAKEKTISIGQPENGMINAVVQVRPISSTKTEVTEYHAIGNDSTGELLLAWAQGKEEECPFDF